MSIDRFHAHGEGVMREHPEGFFVRYEDHVATLAALHPSPASQGSLEEDDSSYELWAGLLEHHEAVEAALVHALDAYINQRSLTQDVYESYRALTKLQGDMKPSFLKRPTPSASALGEGKLREALLKLKELGCDSEIIDRALEGN